MADENALNLTKDMTDKLLDIIKGDGKKEACEACTHSEVPISDFPCNWCYTPTYRSQPSGFQRRDD